MKRWLLIAFLCLLAGATLGQLMYHDPGYVLVAYHRQSLELSLWLAALLWGGSLLLLVFALDLFWRLLNLPGGFGRWRSGRRLRQSLDAFSKGTLLLERGDWRRAEKLLFSAAKLSPAPLPAWLACARAAQLQQAYDRADKYLLLAEEGEGRLAIGLARGRLLLESGDWEAASARLEALAERFPDEPEVIRLRVQALVRLGRWGELAELMPRLQKRGLKTDTVAWVVERRANEEILNHIALAGTRANRAYVETRLGGYFEALSRRLRQDPAIVAAYVQGLLRLGADDRAEVLLRKELSREWQDELVALYGRTRSTRPDEALAFIRQLAAQRPVHAGLLLAQGRLQLQNRDWTGARESFEASLQLQRTPEVLAELSRLLTRLEEAAAPRYVQEGLALLSRDLPDLPLP